jgi:hypothetical protein
MANADRPIRDLLADLGLSYREPPPGWHGYKEVYHTDTGERFAIMTAADASDYLRSQGVLT